MSLRLPLWNQLLKEPGWRTHQHKALAHLVVVQEGLVALVDGASLNLAGARRASTSTARVGQVNSCMKNKAGKKLDDNLPAFPAPLKRVSISLWGEIAITI